MASNPFDQFDTDTVQNPFDQFDQPGQPGRTMATTAQDVAATAAKGITGLSDAVTGLANLPTLGQAGRARDLVGLNEVYEDPAQAEQALNEHQQNIAAGKRNQFMDASPYSAPQQAAQRNVSEADGVLDKLEAAVKNPSTIATTVGESIPTMLAGGAAGRAITAASPLISGVVGGALGEGLMGAGSAAEQTRQQTADGTLTPAQAAMAIGSGIGTAAFGYAGGKLANKLGLEDVDTLFANGFSRTAREAGLEAGEKGFAQTAAEVAGRIAGGGISEGLFEELPQSIQEQMWQNAAVGKPLTEGVDEAAVMGFLSGAAMGGPMNALPRPVAPVATDTPPPLQIDDGKPKGPLSKAADMLIGTSGIYGTAPALAPAPTGDPRMVEAWADQTDAAMAYNRARNQQSGQPGPAVEDEQPQPSSPMQSAIDAWEKRYNEPLYDARTQLIQGTTGLLTDDSRREGEWVRQERDATAYNQQKNKPARQEQEAQQPAAVQSFMRAYDDTDDTPENRQAWPATTPATVSRIEDRKMQGEWDEQEQAATAYNQARNQKPQPEKKTKAELRREQAVTDFNESYNAMGTVPESQGNVTEQEATAFTQKVERERAAQRRQSYIKAFKAKEAEADAAMQDENIPEDVKIAASKQAKEIVDSDPVYQHMAEAKKRGKLNLEAMREAYDSDTIGMINRRYPGILSLVGTVKPDDFANEMGYENLDAMVRRFAEARTKKELTGQIIQEKLDEFKQAEADQGEYFQRMAERQQGAEWAGAGRPATRQSTVFPAPEEGVAEMERLVRRNPEAFTDDDLDHWTFTADQQARLRNAHQEALSALSGSHNSEQAQLGDGTVAENATVEGASLSEALPRSVGATTPAMVGADTTGFIRDQQIRREATATTTSTRQPGESRKAFRERIAEERNQPVQPSEIDNAATEAALSPTNELPEPTDAQKEAGNYRKGHTRIHGLDISIENPAGSVRSGVDQDGKRWETPIRDHYGYIKGTVGKDKDHLDVFIPEGFIPTDKDKVFVVNQIDPKTGKFDEHKIVFGSQDEAAARTTYLRNYDKTGPSRIGSITEMPLDEFKGWLDSGDTAKPASPIPDSDSAASETQPPSPGTDETQPDLPSAGTATAPSPGEASNIKATAGGEDGDRAANDNRGVGDNKLSGANVGQKTGPASIRPADRAGDAKASGGDSGSVLGGGLAFNGREDADVNPQQSSDMADVPETDFGKTNAERPQGVEAELAATSDEDLDAMMDDVFGETPAASEAPKQPATKPAKPRMTPAQKFKSDMERKGAAGDSKGKGFKIATSPTDDGSFVLEVVDENGNRTTIGRPYPPGRGYLREEVVAKAVSMADFTRPAQQATTKAPGKQDEPTFVVHSLQTGQREEVQASSLNAAPKKTAGQITKEGGIAALEGVKSAMDGLSQLFGGKNRLGSGLAFDEETYAKAKPHFVKAWNDAKQVGYSLKELIQYFHDQFGKAIRPYLERFLADVKAGDLTVTDNGNTINQGDATQQQPEGGSDGTRTDNEGTDQPTEAGTLRQDDAAVEGDGDNPLDGVPAEVLQGTEQTEPATNDGGQGSGKDTGGNSRADGNRVPASRGGRGSTAKVHPPKGGTRNNKRDGGQRNLTEAPATIPAQNFVITTDIQLGKGGEVAKFNDNIAAITTLKTIQREQRRATPDEQRVLARYVGWGGLPDAFKNPSTGEVKKGWEDRVATLEALLSPEELATARNSTQNAHYTSQDVVTAMWGGLQQLGFKGGIAVEPSVGTGNFLGLIPQELAGKTRFIAAEFDHITAGIAKLLYPQEAVFHTPFEKLPLPANEFDLIIGNPPFGQTKLNFAHQPHLNRYTIHNQFFLAGLEALKPGGIQAFVVSRYLMDAKDSTVRREIAKRANLLGAVRLPSTAFKENARTDVVTDIIFLQKRPVGIDSDGKEVSLQQPGDHPWVQTVQIDDQPGQEPLTVNAYFASNPERIVGTLGRTRSMHRDNEVGVDYDGDDFKGDLIKAIANALPAGSAKTTKAENSQEIFDKMAESLHLSLTGAEDGSVFINDQGELVHVHERLSPSGEYMLAKRTLTPESPWSTSLTMDHDGRWFEEVDKVNDKGEKVKRIVNGKTTNLNEKTRQYYDNDAAVPSSKRLGKTKYDRLRDAVGLLDLVKEQIRLESISTSSDKEIEANRKALNRAYDLFVDKHGHTNSSTVSGVIADVPNGALLLALEKSYTKPLSKAAATKAGLPERPASAEKASILSRRVIFPPVEITSADTANDALAINLSESGVVDLDRIADLLDKTEQEVITELHDNAETPLIFFDPELKRWEKADEYLGGNVARKLNAAIEAGLEKNITALEKIKPEPWGADKVTVLPGATWVPASVYGDFVAHLTGGSATVRFQKLTNTFYVSADEVATKASNWRTGSVSVAEIVDAMLNSKTLRVTYYDSSSRSTVFDQEATDMANMKVAEVREEFSNWVFKDSERRRQLVDLFNKKYNVRVLKQRDGQHLKLPGKVPDTLIKMRRHQLNAIWRGIVDRFVLYDHAVGAGKTFTGIARAMERRRMGLSQKPMIVVPNHLVEQFAADVYRLYPNARVLAAGKKDMEKKKRRRLFAKIATGDWDVVIVPHSSFAFIGIATETETRYLEAELAVAEEAVLEAEQAAEEEGFTGPRKPLSVKQAEALRDRIAKRLESLREGAGNKDRLLTFEQLGVDDLTIDEAHEFKNLFYTSRLQARGMNPRSGSAKAYDLWTKVRVLRESHGSVAFMTGTPISNSAVEMYTMMRYLAADELAEMDIEHFDAWRSQFVDATTEFEPTESGRGLKEVLRLGRDWSNMRALMDMYYTFSDSVTNEDIQKWYREDNAGKEFPIPRVKGGGRQGVNVVPTPLQKQMLDGIVAGFEGLPDIKDIDERNRTRLRLMDAARKVSIDVRAIDPTIKSDEAGGKLEVAARRIADIYKKWDSEKGTQLVFLDRSIPRARGDKKKLAEYDKKVEALREAERTGDEAAERRAQEALDKYDHNEMAEIRLAQENDWNAYDQIKRNLVANGIPEQEIRYIHEANTDEQKQELFDAVNSGTIRVFIGNTPRMGAGTNVQERLVALHHVDVTWKPSDIEQREGRIIRQGNKLLQKYGQKKFEVEILAYTTEYTIDAKLWSLNATKLKMINGIRQYNGEFNMEFDDDDSVSMAEIAAIASGDPLQLERVKLGAEIKKLTRQKAAFDRQRWGAQDAVDNAQRIVDTYPRMIKANEQMAGVITKSISDEAESAEARTVAIDGKEFAFNSLLETGANNPYRYLADKRDKAKENGEKFSVEINGETTRSMDKAEEKILAALGDSPRYGFLKKLPFSLSVEGEQFYSRDGARRKIVDMANAVMEGKPDDMGETKIGTVEIHGITFDLSVETEATRDRRGEPVKAITFYFEHEEPGTDGEKPYRLHGYHTGTVLRINNKVNINSLDKLFDIMGQVEDVPDDLDSLRSRLNGAKDILPSLLEQANVTFPKEQELADKQDRLDAVEKELSSRKAGADGNQDQQQQQEEAVKLSQSTPTEPGSTISEGQAELGRYNKSRVQIVQSVEELPDNVKFMTAWHGSPHDFDAFSTEKIGTGEGAQAYGFGLYFAGAKEVAEHYKRTLASGYVLDGKTFNDSADLGNYLWDKKGFDDQTAYQFADAVFWDELRTAKDALRGELEVAEKSLKSATTDFQKKTARFVVDKLKKQVAVVDELQPKGRLYQVELAPQEDEYLLWDKPLSEQSEKVRKALNKAGVRTGYSDDTIDMFADIIIGGKDELKKEWRGKDIYYELARSKAGETTGKPSSVGVEQVASDYLHSLGIRGIKYLDGFSRGIADGNYNYVIFNDADISVTAKYQQQRGQIQGAFDPNSGQVYLVADNIPAGQWRKVLEHEGFHRAMASGKFDELLSEIERLENRFQLLGRGAVTDWFVKARAAAQVDRGKPHYIEEIAAYAVAQYEQAPGVIQRWVDRFLVAVKVALRQVFGIGFKIDPAQLREVALYGLRARSVERGGKGEFSTSGNRVERGGMVPAYASQQSPFKPVDTNSPALQKFLQNSQIKEPVFHGSPDEFYTFDRNKLGKNTSSPGTGLGFFFAMDRNESSGYAGPAGATRAFYVDVQNPKRMNASELPKFRGADEAQAYAKRQQLAGYDGIILEDEGHVIAFEPNQVKSAEINTGAFDRGNADVRYSVASTTGTGLTGNGTGPVWETPQDSKTDSFIYNAQDKLIDMKRIQDNIERAAGPIQERHDVRMAEELYHKRAAKRVEDVLVSEVNPLMKELGEIQGADLSEFEEYMHALHAPEANESLRQRNPNEQELKALKAAAKAERDNLQQSATVKRFIDKERELAAAERDVEAGDADDSLIQVISEELDSLRDEPVVGKYIKAREKHRKIRNAVPYLGDNTALSGMSNEAAETLLANLPADKLRKYKALAGKWRQFMDKTRDTLVQYELESQETVDSWAEAFEHYVPLHREDMEKGMGIGQGFSVKGSATRSRTGSNRKVVDIIAHIVAQRERAIVRGEKAAISRALYGLAAANPNPEVWTIETPPTVREFDHVTGLVVSRPDPTYKSKPNAVVHRFINEKGFIEERAVLFNEQSERGMRLAQALKNLDTEQLGTILRASAVLTRWFSAVNTQYNLVFGPVNAIRDAGSAMLHLTGTPLAGRQAAVAKRIATGIKPLFKAIWAEASGKPLNTDIARAWKEMQLEGGTTGFRDMFENAEQRAKDLKQAMLSTATSRMQARFRWVKQQVSQYNDVMENVSRLAVYMEAKDQGLSKAKAASLAKNITLNFNRKGKIASQAGAMYAFFNASMQGTEKMYRTMTGPAGKKILAGGLLLGAAQAVLLASAGFGDDEPPEFIKERSIVVPVGGKKKYVTIPMPLGFNLIPNISRVATEWMLSGGKNTGERITSLIGSFAETFNPIGNAGFSVQTIAPTIIDPLIALSENKDWTGKPIAKPNFNTLKPTPGHERMRDTASAFGIFLSRALNMLSGGTEYTPGLLSPTPDQIDYLIGQAFGGVGRESLKAMQTVSSAFTGEDLPVYKIPLVSRFYGDAADSSATSTAFYRNIKRLNMHAAEVEGLSENRGDVRQYLSDNPEARFIGMAEKTYRGVQKLQKVRRNLLRNGSDKSRVEQIESLITAAMDSLNRTVGEE